MGIDLFGGWDTFNCESRGKAVIGTAGAGTLAGGGYYRVCDTVTSVYEAMDVSAEFAVGVTEGPRVSAKAEWAHSLKIETHNVVVVARGWVGLDSGSTEATMEPGMAPTAETLHRFYELHGDSYISSRVMGAEFIGIYTFKSTTVAESKKIRAELSAQKIQAGGGELDFKLATAIENVSKSTSKVCEEAHNFFGYGLTDADTAAIEKGNVITPALRVQTLNVKTLDSPAVVKFTTSPYEGAHGVDNPEVFDALKKNRKLYTGIITREHLKFTMLGSAIDHTLNVYNSLGWPDVTVKHGAGETKLSDLKKLRDTEAKAFYAGLSDFIARVCQNDSVAPTGTSIEGLPGVVFSGPDMEQGGANVDPTVSLSGSATTKECFDALERGTFPLRKVEVWISWKYKWVEGMRLEYRDGEKVVFHWKDEWDKKPDNAYSHALVFREGEYANYFKAVWSEWIDGLILKTNKGLTWQQGNLDKKDKYEWSGGHKILVGFGCAIGPVWNAPARLAVQYCGIEQPEIVPWPFEEQPL